MRSKEAIEFNEQHYLKLITKMDNKLKELMGEKDHAIFSAQIARDAFREEINENASEEFKQFCLDNWEKITGEKEINIESND